jgi:hypothetical protein
MTAPDYATNLATFHLEGAANDIAAIGGGGAGLGDPETDFFIQGVDCLSKAGWTNDIKGFIVDNDGNADIIVPTDGAIIFFAKYDAQGSLDTQLNGGFQCIHGNTDSAFDHLYIGGKNTIAFNSWVPYVIDPGTATFDAQTGGGASGTHRWVGILANLPTTSGPTKGNPIAIDSIRYGRCDIEYTLGDTGGGGPASFGGAEAVGNVVGTRWGLLELLDGAYQIQGFHSIGTVGTAVDFRDSDKVLFWRKQELNLTNDVISTAFNRVEIINSGTICQWTNIIWSALGTRSKGTFVHTAGTCDLDVCQFFDWDTFTFLTAANLTGCVFSRCGVITAPASIMTGTSILLSTVAADTGALVYNSATNPNGKLDNMTFEQGAADHHAIDFGTAVVDDITLTGIAFNGFTETAGDDTDGAALRFLAASGSLTCSLVGCTVGGVAASAANFFKDDAAGIAVTLVFDTIPLKVTVTDATSGDPITDARVYLHKEGDTGTVYFEDETDVNGEVNDAIAYPGDTDVVGWARQFDISGNDYVQKNIAGTITDTGLSIAVALERVT